MHRQPGYGPLLRVVLPVLLAVLLAAQAEIAASRPETASMPPNIILFLVDDMGWQDTSVPFHTERTVWNSLYRTPHMEELARRGMKFTQAYAAHPVCSPTRTSMMTGKNPARSHIDDWVGHGQSQNQYLKSPKWASKGLQPGDGNVTLPALLRKEGYRTIHIGKAHFGHKGTPGAEPKNLGFEINIGGSHIGHPWGGWISPWHSLHKAAWPEMGDRPKGEYVTDALTDEANQVIASAAKDGVPFFLNMAHYAIHAPIQPAPKLIEGYKDDRPEVEANYASMIESMDASLGSIQIRLHDPDGDGDASDSIAANTLIVFMSDNGGLSNHSRARKGKIQLGNGIEANFIKDWHNRPIRSGKGSGYEGGTRVPMIAAWAGQRPDGKPLSAALPIRPGSICPEPVHMDDFFPTFLDLVGVTHPVPEKERDGQSLVPLLAGKSFTRAKPLYWHYPHQWYGKVGVGLGIEPFSAMRKGDYKVLYFYGDGIADGEGQDPRVELYDLSKDIGEDKDLSKTQPEMAITLRDELIAWLRDVGAGIPIVRITGKPVALPEKGSPLTD
jgi:arylsulfatase A-like enzyme